MTLIGSGYFGWLDIKASHQTIGPHGRHTQG
jgi:hypothetical protein